MTTPLSSEPRQGSRPLSTPVVVLLCATLLVGCLVFARYAYGSWARGLAAIIAPAIFVIGLLGLWITERVRGRPLLPRLPTVVALAALGGLAGASATLLVPALGPAWSGALPGLFYGTLMGVAWSRRPRPAPAAAEAPQDRA